LKHYEEKPKNELMLVSTKSEDVTEYSLAAQLILDKSITMFQVQRLMKKIDEALLQGDKKAFLEFSKQYKKLLN
jgi:uncharacterized protein YpiB (UPF0302 family)